MPVKINLPSGVTVKGTELSVRLRGTVVAGDILANYLNGAKKLMNSESYIRQDAIISGSTILGSVDVLPCGEGFVVVGDSQKIIYFDYSIDGYPIEVSSYSYGGEFGKLIKLQNCKFLLIYSGWTSPNYSVRAKVITWNPASNSFSAGAEVTISSGTFGSYTGKYSAVAMAYNKVFLLYTDSNVSGTETYKFCRLGVSGTTISVGARYSPPADLCGAYIGMVKCDGTTDYCLAGDDSLYRIYCTTGAPTFLLLADETYMSFTRSQMMRVGENVYLWLAVKNSGIQVAGVLITLNADYTLNTVESLGDLTPATYGGGFSVCRVGINGFVIAYKNSSGTNNAMFYVKLIGNKMIQSNYFDPEDSSSGLGVVSLSREVGGVGNMLYLFGSAGNLYSKVYRIEDGMVAVAKQAGSEFSTIKVTVK